MSNVLSEEERQQILALGRLGWTLRRIEASTGVRRETASAYLKAAGIPMRAPRGRLVPKPASVEGVLTDSSGEISAESVAKPASAERVLTDFAARAPTRAPAASGCEGGEVFSE